MTGMAVKVSQQSPRRWSSLARAVFAAGLAVTLLTPAVLAASISPRELVPLLTRSGIGPDLTIVDVIYAPPLFFDATGIPVPDELDPDTSLAFILQETVHDGELPAEVARAFLLLPDGATQDPFDARVTAEDEHHRVSRLLFERPADWPAALAGASGTPVLRLIVPGRDGSYTVANTFEWVVPIEIDDTGASDTQ